MKKKTRAAVLMVLFLVTVVAAVVLSFYQPGSNEISAAIANPASQYCEQHNGTVQIVTAQDGSQSGNCVLANRTCDEWAYFRGEC